MIPSKMHLGPSSAVQKYCFKCEIRKSGAKIILSRINELELCFNSTHGWKNWSIEWEKHAQRLKTLTLGAPPFVERSMFSWLKRSRQSGLSSHYFQQSLMLFINFQLHLFTKSMENSRLFISVNKETFHCGSLNQIQRRVNRDCIKKMVVAVYLNLDLHENFRVYEIHRWHCQKNWTSICLNQTLECLHWK